MRSKRNKRFHPPQFRMRGCLSTASILAQVCLCPPSLLFSAQDLESENPVDAQALSRRFSDGAATPSDRMLALQEMTELSADLRRRTLLDALPKVDAEFAVSAARVLLNEHYFDEQVNGVLREACTSWDTLHRSMLVWDLIYVGKPEIFDGIVKDLLRDAISEHGKPGADIDSIERLVGGASEFFCRVGNCQNSDLILDALKAFPGSRVSWLVAARGCFLDDAGRSLAVSIYQDEEQPIRTRMAAAAAVAHMNEAARVFVFGQISAFLREYDAATLEHSLKGMRSGNREAIRNYAAFRERYRSLEVLAVLDSEEARRIVFDEIGNATPIIEDGLRLIAAVRWPEELLDWAERGGQEGLDNRILALIAVEHEGLMDRCLRLGDPNKIQKAMDELRELGVASFSLFRTDGKSIWGGG